MPDKRILIVPLDTLRKVDDNRGDMSRAEFIDFLVDAQFQAETKEAAKEKGYVTQQNLQEFEQNMKTLLRSFLDFFVSYGLELNNHPAKSELEKLSKRLEGS